MAVVMRGRSALRFTIGRTIAVPDIGLATGTTSGGLAIGFIGTGRKFGDAATTSYADTRAASRDAVATGSQKDESVRCADLRPVHLGSASNNGPQGRLHESSFYGSFKRWAERCPSVPSENAQPSPGTLVRSARFYGN
jgi:hypothetical protein